MSNPFEAAGSLAVDERLPDRTADGRHAFLAELIGQATPAHRRSVATPTPPVPMLVPPFDQRPVDTGGQAPIDRSGPTPDRAERLLEMARVEMARSTIGRPMAGAGCGIRGRRAPLGIAPPEAIAGADSLRRHLGPGGLSPVRARLVEMAERYAGLSHLGRLEQELCCGFTTDARGCELGDRRPLACLAALGRSADSTVPSPLSAHWNRKGEDRVGDGKTVSADCLVTRPAVTQPDVPGICRRIYQQIAERLADDSDVSLDMNLYELHAAVLRALNIPDAMQRWLAGEDIFRGCACVEAVGPPRIEKPSMAMSAPPVSAATIYYESFSDTGALDGSTPDTTIGTNTWTASDWQQDGTIADQNNSADNAWLSFTPQIDTVYTLRVTFDAVASGTTNSSWSAFGFGNGSNTTVDFWGSPNNTAPWALYRATQTPDQIVSFSGPGLVGGSNAAHGTVAGPVTLSIVLDTTGSQWTAEWFEGSNSLRTYTYSTAPTISTVGFGRRNDSDGPIYSFELSDDTIIPEPGSVVLLGTALLGLLCLRRRK